MSTFSERLLALLEEKNITQRALAEKIGVREATISRYIHENRYPHSIVASKIAEALGVSTDYLLGITDNYQVAEQEIKYLTSYSQHEIATLKELNNKPITSIEIDLIKLYREAALTPEEEKGLIALMKAYLQNLRAEK